MVEEAMNLGFMRAGLDVQPVLFANREDAGERLGKALLRYRGQRPLVLGIPRGGVPVAAEGARAGEGGLDVIVARKLGSPFSPELAVGAVTADGAVYLNKQTIDELGVPGDYLDQVTKEKRAEAEARERRLRAGRAPVPIEGRTVILGDDGPAPGTTTVP